MDAVFKTNQGVFNFRTAGIWIKNNHVLLHKIVGDDFWALPGGRVKIMEESQNAVQREMKEELDVQVKVERLLWTVENFFTYNSKNFHELGFYYLISSAEQYEIQAQEFFGIEGEKFIYKWMPLNELEAVTMYPEFLKVELRHIPNYPKHMVIKQ